MHAPARLNEQFMNFYWRKFWRGDLKLLIVILRFQIEIVINCDFKISDRNRRVGPHNPRKLIIRNKNNY